ncbi:class I SAM-dependent methyltransferase [Candidatus Eisenbacteria bacterium]|uniref:Class I SAM-dependent methyltransferase n=1 Tax=Eiseniibacteriota bacterium TaxID=2212470 RepID=A0ABV6YQ61_UNCEI
MANFPPLKNYILYCLDRLIEQYGLESPFLDVGCGIGDVSRHIALRGWCGTAIDASGLAVEAAKKTLASLEAVKVRKEALLEATGTFKTIVVMDVLEHTEDDEAALEKISSLLDRGGHVVITIPSNPGEWRWDDVFYGHRRRYVPEEFKARLVSAGLEPLVIWDFTYPAFWIMRRLYTKWKSMPADVTQDEAARTEISSAVNAWDIPVVSWLLSGGSPFWKLVYRLQFDWFRGRLKNGFEMIVLARKPDRMSI